MPRLERTAFRMYGGFATKIKREGRGRPAQDQPNAQIFFDFVKILSSIGRVSLPVNVFC